MPETSLSQGEFKRRFAQAIAMRDAGDPQGAVRQLESLLARGERVATLAGTIGTMLLGDMKTPDRAIPYLQWTVTVAPRSKLASLSLCHALIATDQSQRAIAEASRYLAIEESEEHRKLLASLADVNVPGDGASYAQRLTVVLLVETSRIPDPYAAIHAGLAMLKSRLRATNGLLERLDLHLVTFAGRVWSLTQLKDVTDNATCRSLGSASCSGIALESSGLISALTEAAEAVREDLRSRDRQGLRAWLVMLTAGEMGADSDDLVAKAKAVLNPLRENPGLNVFPVLIGRGGGEATLRNLTGANPLRLRETSIDAFFMWLAENVGATLKASSPGAQIRLTPPTWAIAA